MNQVKYKLIVFVFFIPLGFLFASSPHPTLELLFEDNMLNYGLPGGEGDVLNVSGMEPVFAAGGLDASKCLDNTSASGMGTSGGLVRFSSSAPVAQKLEDIRSFTVMGWMKSDTALGSNAGIVSMGSFRLRGDSTDRLKLEVNGQAILSDPVANYDITDWTFFAVTYDGTQSANNVKFYVASNDGLDTVTLDSIAGSDAGTVFMDNQFLYVGNVNTSGTGAFDGLFDTIRIFSSKFDASGALTLDQIQQWKNKNDTDIDRLRILDTRFEGNVVSEGRDYEIGFIRQYNGLFPLFTSGGVDGGLCLDMTNATGMGQRGPFFAFTTEPDGIATQLDDLQSFTLMGWIKSSQTMGNGARIYSCLDGNGDGIELATNHANRLTLIINGTEYDSSTAGNYGCTDWKFFAVRFDGTKSSANIIFFFGQNDGTGNVTVDTVHTTGPLTITSDPGGINIGNRGTVYPFAGYIDSVKLFASKQDGSASLGTSDIGAYKNDHATTFSFPLPEYELKKSDVAIMRTSSSIPTTGFNANRVVWNYDTHGGVVKGFEALGVAASQTINFTATSYDGGLNYEDGKNYTNDPTMPSRTRDFDGNIVEKNGEPGMYYPSTPSQAFQDDTMGRMLDFLLPLEPYNMQFDGSTADRHAAYLGYGIGFDDSTKAGFRDYLDNKYTDAQLLSLYNIPDISTFDYKQWLITEYSVIDNQDYVNRYETFSLTPELEYFLEDNITSVFTDLQAACAAANPPAKLSGNIATMRRYTRVLFPVFDFLNMELNPAESYGSIDHLDSMRCKIAETYDIPAYMVNNKNVSFYIQQNEKPNNMNCLIAAVYANGGIMLCPWNLWAGDGPRYYSHWDSHAALTHFVRNHRELFDGYKAHSQVGLLWNCDNLLGELDQFGKLLFNQNITFDVVPFGDRYPYSPIDVDAVAAKYDKLVRASDLSTWSAQNQNTVNQLAAKVPIVTHPYSLGLTNPWVDVTGVNVPDVWVLPRKHTANPAAPRVVHLVNRSYSSSTDSVDTTGCTVEINSAVIDGLNLDTVTWLGPLSPQMELAVTPTASGFKVTLPYTPLWSVLRLDVSADPGDFDFSGQVNTLDLVWMLTEWLLCDTPGQPQCQTDPLNTDLNTDNVVDFEDFSDFSRLWQGD